MGCDLQRPLGTKNAKELHKQKIGMHNDPIAQLNLKAIQD